MQDQAIFRDEMFVPIGDISWMRRAACAGMDTDLFFPEAGVVPHVAKAVCDACPVRAECLRYAERQKFQEGWFGGIAPRKRKNRG